MVFNKVDALFNENREEVLANMKRVYPEAVFISAQKGLNLNALEQKITDLINSELTETEIKIPVSNEEAYKIINKLHGQVEILETKYLTKSIKMKIRGNKTDIARIKKAIG
jgi:GTP-binding protein HflX